MGRYSSGQRGETVNLLAYAFLGSNPSLPTISGKYCIKLSGMKNTIDKTHRIYTMTFASVYPLYIKKVERKGHTKAEVDEIIFWLTGYDKKGLQKQVDKENTFETFFDEAPLMNPNVSLITGVICGVRIEDIQDKLMKKIRYLDKLVDELAKGRAMEKILRK